MGSGRRCCAVARPPRRNRWGLIAGGVLALAAALAWVATHTPTSAPPARAVDAAPRGGADDAELEQLLARADQALAAGALTAPAGANAAELYRAALQRNARDPRALTGLEQVIDHLVIGPAAATSTKHHSGRRSGSASTRSWSPARAGPAAVLFLRGRGGGGGPGPSFDEAALDSLT